MSAIIQLTFDGSLVRNRHEVTMRDLAQTMAGLQAAADRACLDVVHGNVWKHQRLPRDLYPLSEFIVGDSREGSYIIEFLSEQAGFIVDRMKRAIADPYADAVAEGGKEVFAIGHQIAGRKDAADMQQLLRYEDLAEIRDAAITRSYGDRSINKEFGQMLNPLAREQDGYLKLVMKSGDDDIAETYEFNNDSAKQFKRIIGSRKLSHPVIYEGIIRELDRGNAKAKKFKGKFINESNKKTIVIHIEGREDFSTLIPYLDRDEPFKIIASPIIEFDSFDPTGGDIQFLKIYHG